MSGQVYSVPDQTEGRRKAFFGWEGISLSSKLSLTCGGNVNYYKSARHPIPTRANREHPGWVSSYILFFAKLKGREEEGLFWRVQEGWKRDEKVSPFVKFEIIPPLPCFLLDPFTNKHCRTWSPMIYLWIDSSTCQK